MDLGPLVAQKSLFRQGRLFWANPRRWLKRRECVDGVGRWRLGSILCTHGMLNGYCGARMRAQTLQGVPKASDSLGKSLGIISRLFVLFTPGSYIHTYMHPREWFPGPVQGPPKASEPPGKSVGIISHFSFYSHRENIFTPTCTPVHGFPGRCKVPRKHPSRPGKALVSFHTFRSIHTGHIFTHIHPPEWLPRRSKVPARCTLVCPPRPEQRICNGVTVAGRRRRAW